MASLADGVTLRRGWPRRSALLLDETPDPQLPAVLHRLGFTTVVTSLNRAADDASTLGAFTFLLLTARSLDTDEAVPVVRRLRTMSPSAMVLLQRPPGRIEPDVLVRAVRCGVGEVVDPAPGALEQTVRARLGEAGRLRERVLAIGAHPDDVELGCAGTLLDHRLRGDRVSILTLSGGAVGGDSTARTREATAAAEAIGAQLLSADLPDTRIDEGSPIRLNENVVATLDPTVVYVHSRQDNHQDHRTVAAATISATRGVRRVFAYQSPSATNEFRPTQFVPIDHVVQRKVQVLRMFASQSERSYLDPELIVSGARYWARHLAAQARYAEPFEVIRSMGDLRQSIGVPAGVNASQLGFAVPTYAGASPSAGADDVVAGWASVPW
jgi:LmbE family N-acetylglucosaminyl deacetylase